MQLASSHIQRIVTGIGLALLLTAGLSFGGNVLLVLALAASTLALLEFYSLFWSGNAQLPNKALGLVLGAGVIIAAHMGQPWVAMGCISGAFLVGSLQFLTNWGRGNDNACFINSLVMVAGILYIPLLLVPVLSFSVLEQLLVAIAAVVSDTGAYYIGTYFGKRRIWPRVSPKKSWAGSLGGLVLCVIACTLLGYFWGRLPWWNFALLGVALNIASQLGDFFESALKRTLHVKDSGTLLPGHGGLLDRIDSLLFVIPVYAGLNSILDFF